MGRQLKNFDKFTVRLLREELQKAVQTVADFYGVAVEVGNASFSMNHIKFQMKVDSKDTNGEVIIKEAEYFTAYAELYGLKATDLNRVFKHNGIEYKIIGLVPNRNAKYRIITQNTGNKKIYKFQLEHVRRMLDAQENPVVPTHKRLNRREQ